MTPEEAFKTGLAAFVTDSGWLSMGRMEDSDLGDEFADGIGSEASEVYQKPICLS